MKKFRIVMALLCLAAGVGLVSCQPSNPTETPTGETTKYIVTFNTNGGSVVTAAEVVEGEIASAAHEPTGVAVRTRGTPTVNRQQAPR
jgi:hypothetical protein